MVLTLKLGIWKTHGDNMYSQMFFLLMSSGDDRNILKVFVAGREINLAPPVRPPRPGTLEHHVVL